MIDLRTSFAHGYACLAAWADLLDAINVFPVADGDTGTNLRISLAPLRNIAGPIEHTGHLLATSATGNSGNIAAAFFGEFCKVTKIDELPQYCSLGRTKAWQAVATPKHGTMLTIFEDLSHLFTQKKCTDLYAAFHETITASVLSTRQILPELRKAGVVDAGALAIFVFFDGFLHHLTDCPRPLRALTEIFPGSLTVDGSFTQENTFEYCIDALLQVAESQEQTTTKEGQHLSFRDKISRLGNSVVLLEEQAQLKIHMHTKEPQQLHKQLGDLGIILQWHDTAIRVEERGITWEETKTPLHLVTDAAGSLPRTLAQQYGITLLDSHIIIDDDSRPESLYTADDIYPLLLQGKKITTAQASTFERHRHYERICSQFGPSLYLSVGSAYTGNFAAAGEWQKSATLGHLLTVIDTGAASGRLAVIAILTARAARYCRTGQEVITAAEDIIDGCREYVFINELKYLVAGGRVTRAKGFFGDLLHLKPIISPTIDGVVKVGTARSAEGQIHFAKAKLAEHFKPQQRPLIYLQYSDNKEWVETTVKAQIQSLLPMAEIMCVPLSLTSGVHMGPGTWSMACCLSPTIEGKNG